MEPFGGWLNVAEYVDSINIRLNLSKERKTVLFHNDSGD